ncbi:hypothetical protein N9260_00460 [bacterium]|nr:hypothetical protein [bacterium]
MDCPISSAERRLDDAVIFWKRAHDFYFDPDEFRRNVQTSIQTFRTVTFLPQKAKASIPGFESWYDPKMKTMGDDARLRWAIKARNKIEKQGDLETQSKLIVEHIASWLPSAKHELDLPPTTRLEHTAQVLGVTFPQSECKCSVALSTVETGWFGRHFLPWDQSHVRK